MPTFLYHLYQNKSHWGLISRHQDGFPDDINKLKYRHLRRIVQNDGHTFIELRGIFASSTSVVDALCVFDLSKKQLAIYGWIARQNHMLYKKERFCIRMTHEEFDVTCFYIPALMPRYLPKQAIRWYFAALLYKNPQNNQPFELYAKMNREWHRVITLKTALKSFSWKQILEAPFPFSIDRTNLLYLPFLFTGKETL